MGRTKLTAGRKSTGPVVLHLDRSVAHDLLQALTQALGPHSTNLANARKKPPKGRQPKATGPKGTSKGKGPKRYR
jgi:hypothetical protein